MIELKYAEEQYISFIFECFNKITAESFLVEKSWVDFFKYNFGEPIVVLRDRQPIGFFSSFQEKGKEDLIVNTYMHHSACRMGISWVLKAAIIRSVLLSIDNNIKGIYFRSWHKIIPLLVSNILPELKKSFDDDFYFVSVDEIRQGKGLKNVKSFPIVQLDKEKYTFKF